MTKYPRAFKFRRVPAIPPRVIQLPAATHVFSFNYDDRGIYETPKPWQDFLRCLGVKEERVLRTPASALFHFLKDWKLFAEKRGMKMTVSSLQTPSSFDFPVATITLTEEKPKQPKVSPKLAATFPWKMRKYLNQKP